MRRIIVTVGPGCTEAFYQVDLLVISMVQKGYGGGDIEETAPHKMWDSMKWNSAEQMKHLRTFVMTERAKYQELVPEADLISPNKGGDPYGYTGWAYCARTDEKDFFLLYFEKDCPQAVLRGALRNTVYSFKWFDPRTGTWHSTTPGTLDSDSTGRIILPRFPSNEDWCMKLVS